MSLAAIAILLALTRAELIQRMRAPVITQADGMVRVYAMCPEDMRREYQSPIASFAADTVSQLYRGNRLRQTRFANPAIVIRIGNVRTNLAEVVGTVQTNRGMAVTHINVPSPGYADIGKLRLEVIKGFSRAVLTNELDDAAAIALYRRCVPNLRIADTRARLENWLVAGGKTAQEDEEALALMRRVIEPGWASRRDVLIFASRLFLYPTNYDDLFLGKYRCLDFASAIKLAKIDPRIYLAAARKADRLIVFGGGRSETLREASKLYYDFLRELALQEKDEDELTDMLEAADARLALALLKADGQSCR